MTNDWPFAGWYGDVAFHADRFCECGPDDAGSAAVAAIRALGKLAVGEARARQCRGPYKNRTREEQREREIRGFSRVVTHCTLMAEVIQDQVLRDALDEMSPDTEPAA